MTRTDRQDGRGRCPKAPGGSSAYLCCDSGPFRIAVQATEHDLPPRLGREDLDDPEAWHCRLVAWIFQQS